MPRWARTPPHEFVRGACCVGHVRRVRREAKAESRKCDAKSHVALARGRAAPRVHACGKTNQEPDGLYFYCKIFSARDLTRAAGPASDATRRDAPVRRTRRGEGTARAARDPRMPRISLSAVAIYFSALRGSRACNRAMPIILQNYASNHTSKYYTVPLKRPRLNRDATRHPTIHMHNSHAASACTNPLAPPPDGMLT